VLAPSTAVVVDAFALGGQVESALGSQLALPRERVGVAPQLTRPFADVSTDPARLGRLQAQLLDVPGWAKDTVDAVSGSVRRVCSQQRGEVMAGALAELAARTAPSPGQGAAVPAPLADDLDALLGRGRDPLVRAFSAVFAIRSGWPAPVSAGTFAEHESAIRSLAAKLDPQTERAVARVVLGMAKAEEWRLAAVQPWYGGREIDFGELARMAATRPVIPARARSFDYARMTQAGLGLALAADGLSAHQAAHPLPANVNVSIRTPLGEVVLDGRRTDDTRMLETPALVVDQGGNDTYRGVVAGPATPAVPLSVLIDMGGDDSYQGDGVDGTQGAGVLSFGFLIDKAGNDRYQANSYAQGAGYFGVGALLDAAGDDTYQAGSYAQGSGQLGLGVAIDIAGNDSWAMTTAGQGYGAARSGGLLLDAAGDDRYVADDTHITNPSPQQADHNTSLAQGAGFGFRGNGAASLTGGTGSSSTSEVPTPTAAVCSVRAPGTGSATASSTTPKAPTPTAVSATPRAPPPTSASASS